MRHLKLKRNETSFAIALIAYFYHLFRNDFLLWRTFFIIIILMMRGEREMLEVGSTEVADKHGKQMFLIKKQNEMTGRGRVRS